MPKRNHRNLENWLALYHCFGIGPKKFQQYLQFDPGLNELPKNLKPDWIAVNKDLAWLQTTVDASIITLDDVDYPAQLKNIADPPPLLYVQGDVTHLSKPQVAMVGSRNCSTYGMRQAEHFAQQLANIGIVVTSGLALGIDGASHRGALRAVNGKTIAVLAHGMDIVYPPQHKGLSEQIIANGCLVSEYSFGIIPLPQYFPSRNRLISGLAMGVLVVEAALNSGSLITARCAIDQGREVFAIPGMINQGKSRGCNQLIKQGAKLVENLDDILEELGALLNSAIRDKYACNAKSGMGKKALSAKQQQLLQFIDYDSTCVDVIVENTGLASSAVGAMLLELELQGVITAVPGGYARKLD